MPELKKESIGKKRTTRKMVIKTPEEETIEQIAAVEAPVEEKPKKTVTRRRKVTEVADTEATEVKKTAVKKTTVKKTTAKKTADKKNPAKETTAKKTATKKKTTKKVTDEEVVAPKLAPKKITVDKIAPPKKTTKRALVTAKLNEKTELLKRYFLEHKMEMFTSEDLLDANETTILRTRMEVGGAQLPMAILIDKSAYMLIQVEVMPEVAKGEEKFGKFARSLVALNNVVRLFKFTISDNGDLMLNVVLTFPDKTFDPSLFHAILMEIMRYLDRDYQDLIKAINNLMENQ